MWNKENGISYSIIAQMNYFANLFCHRGISCFSGFICGIICVYKCLAFLKNIEVLFDGDMSNRNKSSNPNIQTIETDNRPSESENGGLRVLAQMIAGKLYENHSVEIKNDSIFHIEKP